jgi:hypothetical protein
LRSCSATSTSFKRLTVKRITKSNN